MALHSCFISDRDARFSLFIARDYSFRVVPKPLIPAMSTSIYFLLYENCFILRFLRQELVLVQQDKRFVMTSLLRIGWLTVMQKRLPMQRWIQTKCWQNLFSQIVSLEAEHAWFTNGKQANVHFLSWKCNEGTEALWYWNSQQRLREILY